MRTIEPGRLATEQPHVSATPTPTDHQPIRTCVGCRTRRRQQALLRVVVSRGHVVADPARRRPGRGAYVCTEETCVDRALQRGGLARALRAAIPEKDVAGLKQLVLNQREGRSSQR